MLEKEAVRIGGGVNHRIGLFDMILLEKTIMLIFAGGIERWPLHGHRADLKKRENSRLRLKSATSKNWTK